MATMILSPCGHEAEYNPEPTIGDTVWCRRCRDYATAWRNTAVPVPERQIRSRYREDVYNAIVSAQKQGLSQRAGLKLARANGVHVTTMSWLEWWWEVEKTVTSPLPNSAATELK